jgi:hypothetical protein
LETESAPSEQTVVMLRMISRNIVMPIFLFILHSLSLSDVRAVPDVLYRNYCDIRMLILSCPTIIQFCKY